MNTSHSWAMEHAMNTGPSLTSLQLVGLFICLLLGHNSTPNSLPVVYISPVHPDPSGPVQTSPSSKASAQSSLAGVKLASSCYPLGGRRLPGRWNCRSQCAPGRALGWTTPGAAGQILKRRRQMLSKEKVNYAEVTANTCCYTLGIL